MLLDGSSKHEFLRQRRVFVTPTLFRYSIASEEESNRVLRKYKSILPNFIRLTFTNEKLEKGYYFNMYAEKNNFILGYIFRIVAKGFQIGNLDFKFLSYSNSHLKNHSAWFLCSNNPNCAVTESDIERYMGNFDKEKNVLKKYARKGQCFSTSKFILTLSKDQV